MNKINFKSKKLLISVVIIILGLFLILSFLNGDKVSQYETFKVERGNLTQTVDVTGKVESANSLALHFETMGRLETLKVEVGDNVKAGQWLANLSLSELNANLAQAQSSLNQKLAGATMEQVAVLEKQIESAKVVLAQAEKNLEDTISVSENTINAKYDYALNLLEDASIKMYNAYTTVDNIQSNYFTNNDQEGLTVRSNQEYQIKRPKDETNILIDKAKESKNKDDIDSAIHKSVDSLNNILLGLTLIRNVCEEVTYQNRVTVSEKSALDSQKSAISAAQISMSSLENEISLLKIQNNNNINSATFSVNSAKASLELQYANYNSLVAKPRDIDISYYEAILAQAVAARNKAIIFAPISGVITKINKSKGELVSVNETMIEMLSPNYEINVDVPETDVTKIKIGDETEISLNALGKDNKLEGVVLRIDPASTNIQDVVYYKVNIGIKEDGSDLLKPGMSADVLILTDSKNNVIFVPARSILTNEETNDKYVRVLKNGEIEERTVEVGIKADNAFTEIISGIEENEEVVLKIIK